MKNREYLKNKIFIALCKEMLALLSNRNKEFHLLPPPKLGKPSPFTLPLNINANGL